MIFDENRRADVRRLSATFHDDWCGMCAVNLPSCNSHPFDSTDPSVGWRMCFFVLLPTHRWNGTLTTAARFHTNIRTNAHKRTQTNTDAITPHITPARHPNRQSSMFMYKHVNRLTNIITCVSARAQVYSSGSLHIA